jgi:hypothetical protein
MNIEYFNVPTSTPITEINKLYKPVFDRYKKHHENNKSYIGNINTTFDDISGNDSNTLSRELWRLLKTTYEINTLNSYSNYIDKKSLNNNTDLQESVLSDSKVSLSELEKLNETNKRHIEINMNMHRRINDQLNMLKVILVFLGVLLIIPLLRYANAISKSTSLILYLFGLIIIIIIYLINYFNNINKDNNNYNEYDFKKPDSNTAALSKSLLDLSSKDKSRCQALQELENEMNIDLSGIDLNIDQYKNTQPSLSLSDPQRSQCSIYN